MVDRGFTIQDQLKLDLYIPPFLEGCTKLPANKVLEGHKITHVRAHMERAISRIKNFYILKSTLSTTLSRITNQLVNVCAMLVNFQPVSPVDDECIIKVKEYFWSLYSSDTKK